MAMGVTRPLRKSGNNARHLVSSGHRDEEARPAVGAGSEDLSYLDIRVEAGIQGGEGMRWRLWHSGWSPGRARMVPFAFAMLSIIPFRNT